MWREDGPKRWMWCARTPGMALARGDVVALSQLLDEIEAVAEDRGQRKGYPYVRRAERLAIPGLLRARTEALCLRVAERGGAGTSHLEPALVGLVARAADIASLPFWERLASVQRERDKFARRRRQLAADGVAFLCWRTGAEVAIEALGAFAASPAEILRAAALVAAAAVVPRVDMEPPPEGFAALVRRVATADRTFGPRFLARRALSAWGEEIPNDAPDGAYRFTVAPFRDDSSQADTTARQRRSRTSSPKPTSLVAGFTRTRAGPGAAAQPSIAATKAARSGAASSPARTMAPSSSRFRARRRSSQRSSHAGGSSPSATGAGAVSSRTVARAGAATRARSLAP